VDGRRRQKRQKRDCHMNQGTAGKFDSHLFSPMLLRIRIVGGNRLIITYILSIESTDVWANSFDDAKIVADAREIFDQSHDFIVNSSCQRMAPARRRHARTQGNAVAVFPACVLIGRRNKR
jgi:hypothetical protein